MTPSESELTPRVALSKHKLGAGKPIELIYAMLAKIPSQMMLPAAAVGHRLVRSRQLRGIKRRTEAR